MSIALLIMQNKRGTTMTLEQLVKIVLAIAGVIMFLLVVYILVYGLLFPSKTNETQAKGTVENIAVVLDSLHQGDTKPLDPIYSPSGWTIVGFKYDSAKISSFEKPDAFIGKNAICVCQKVCKREVCRETKKPLQIDATNLFVYKIGETKIFNVTDMGLYYEIKDIASSSSGGGGTSGAG
jgi:hypothetical protein